MGEYKGNDWHFWKCDDQCCHLDRIWNHLEMSCSVCPLGITLCYWVRRSIHCEWLPHWDPDLCKRRGSWAACMHCFLPDFRHSINNCFKHLLLPSPPGSCASNCEPKKGNPFCFKLLLPGVLSQKEKKYIRRLQVRWKGEITWGRDEGAIHSINTFWTNTTCCHGPTHKLKFSIRREKRNILGRGNHMYTLLQESFQNKHSDTEARIAPERLLPGSNLLFHFKLSKAEQTNK